MDLYDRFTGDVVLSANTTTRMQTTIDSLVGKGESLANLDLMPEGSINNLRFSDTDLGGMVAESVGFEACKFVNVTLERALLTRATFYRCHFERVTLRNSFLSNAKFDQCQITDSVFSDTAMPEVTMSNNSTIRGWKLRGCNLSGLRLDDSKITDSDAVIQHPRFGERDTPYCSVYNSYVYMTSRRRIGVTGAMDIAVRIRARSVWLRNATAAYFNETVTGAPEREAAVEARNQLLALATEAGWMDSVEPIATI
jgi:hypothetical protein